MNRRELAGFLPVLLAATAKAADTPELPSKAYPFDQLPVKKNNENQGRAVLDGMTHAGCQLEVHLTSLPPGGMPHPAHHHVHEEMILVQEGTMEVAIMGKKTRLGPGSVAFIHSNEEHGWQNVGDTRAQYFVIAIGNRKG